MSKLLNEREAADFLKLARETLRTWRSRGCGPKYIRLGEGKGSSIRYDLAELENFIDEGRVG
jgi:hypothetical protein